MNEVKLIRNYQACEELAEDLGLELSYTQIFAITRIDNTLFHTFETVSECLAFLHGYEQAKEDHDVL